MTDNFNASRREFLLNVLRGTVLLGVLGGIGALVAKRGETCVGNGICRGCVEFAQCGLPQALSAKEAPAGKR
jgi:hypothetical protein